MQRNAFVVGASGAVGKQLIDALVSSRQFKEIRIIGRREIPLNHESLQQVVVDFDAIEKHQEVFKGLDIGFCALGTTRGKAGRDGFYKVDHDYVVNVAKAAKTQGVREFVLVTSAGSNENSWFLYPRTKGEAERDVRALDFDKLLIVRPGLLEGPREEYRLGESLVKVFIKPLKLLSNSLTISTTDVAKVKNHIIHLYSSKKLVDFTSDFLKAMVVGGCSTELKGYVVWDNATLLEKRVLFDNLCK